MAVLEILKTPNPILNTKCEKITDFGEATQEIVRNLIDTAESAHDPEAAGLAAPQIGYSKKICLVRRFFSSGSKKKILIENIILVNPKMISSSRETDLDWEGCLSIPDKYGKVERSKRIKIKAQNEKGEEFKMSASGYLARVIQHEMDHLEGILLIDKAVGKTKTESEIDELFAQEDYHVRFSE